MADLWPGAIAKSTHFVFGVTLITDLISCMRNRAAHQKLSGKCFGMILFDIIQMFKISSVYLS